MLKKNIKKNYKEGTNLAFLSLKKLLSNNTSGTTGVYWNASLQKWGAYITIKKERIFLGYYKDKDKAIKARKKAEEKYFKPILNKYTNKQSTENIGKIKYNGEEHTLKEWAAILEIKYTTLYARYKKNPNNLDYIFSGNKHKNRTNK